MRILIGCLMCCFFFACGNKKNTIAQVDNKTKAVNSNYFLKHKQIKIDTVTCTLSNGLKTKCLQITNEGFATKHEKGPWCPEKITDSESKGGLWFKDGQMYKVDGEFITGLPELYEDEKWLMYDEDGHVLRTKTKEDCQQLAGAQLLEEYTNYCIECLPEYVSNFSKKFLIPIQPIMIENPIVMNHPPKMRPNQDHDHERPKGPPPGGRGGGPAKRGVALNGVVFDAPAPVDLILSGYTIPPLDHAGGHINMDTGYHYHSATGLSLEIKQTDGHAPLIGYAMDGIGLYAYKNEKDNVATDLDKCRGHYDATRGYHYHVDDAGNNNFINCFSGATAAN